MTGRATVRRVAGSVLLALLLGLHGILSAAAAGTRDGESACVTPGAGVVTETPWPQEQLGLAALGAQFQGFGVRIAVLSSGVTADHPQLRGRVLDGLSVGDDVGPANQDCLGFGTAVAGAAVAAAVSGTPLVGVAPQASVLPVRLPDWVVNPTQTLNEEQLAQAADLIARAIELTLPRDPQVIVLPSIAVPDVARLRSAIADAEEQGRLVVQGAPTHAGDNDEYPAGYPEVVTAEGSSPEGQRTETNLAEKLLDLAAPGVQVPVLTPRHGHRLVTTSAVAAGYTAGAAALVIEAMSPISPAQVRSRLTTTSGAQIPATLPMLDPATAMSPTPPARPVAAPDAIGRLLATPAGTDTAKVAGYSVAVASLSVLAMLALSVAATTRGRRRNWRPAGVPATSPPEVPALVLTDDPYRPVGASGAWWASGRLAGGLSIDDVPHRPLMMIPPSARAVRRDAAEHDQPASPPDTPDGPATKTADDGDHP